MLHLLICIVLELLNKIQAKHNLILKLVLVLIITFFITKFIPKDPSSDLQPGILEKEWNYPDLVLEHDLLVKKSATELEEEKRQLLNDLPLAFELNNEEKNEKLLKLDNLYDFNELKGILEEIYNTGI
ncbi:MAG: hypothetical protein JNM96_00090, partial [Bacteroidia bacterium]|nr:hypothetical protein [Bacteroidia bacterium]